MDEERFKQAIEAFDAYNARDPNHEIWEGLETSKELRYAMRMSEWLDRFSPGAPAHMKLAARCQHIGRWEIPRNTFPEGRKGYLLWRNKLKFHHADIAGGILGRCGYSEEEVSRVQFLVMKKELATNPETRLLEDVICLVFLEYYLSDFAVKHHPEKIADILQKTMKKMSARAIEIANEILNKKEG